MFKMILFPCIILLSGCSFNGLFLEGQENKPVVIIEHPPNRVAFGGNLNPEDIENIQMILIELSKKPYEDHAFKFPMGVSFARTEKEEKIDSFIGIGSGSKEDTKSGEAQSSGEE